MNKLCKVETWVQSVEVSAEQIHNNTAIVCSPDLISRRIRHPSGCRQDSQFLEHPHNRVNHRCRTRQENRSLHTPHQHKAYQKNDNKLFHRFPLPLFYNNVEILLSPDRLPAGGAGRYRPRPPSWDSARRDKQKSGAGYSYPTPHMLQTQFPLILRRLPPKNCRCVKRTIEKGARGWYNRDWRSIATV